MVRDADADPAPSSRDRAYEALKRRAADFRFRPNERVSDVALGRDLGMSRVPIREALNRLASEGLIDAAPGGGYMGRRLDTEELCGLYEVRGDLEAGVLRAIPHLPQAEALAELEAETRAILDELPDIDIESLVDRDEAFHQRLAGLAGNRERRVLLAGIDARVRFARRLNLEDPARARAAFEEHLDILTALRADDREGAVRTMQQHLRLSTQEALATVHRGIVRIFGGAAT